MKIDTRSGTKVNYRRRFLERLTLFVLSVILYIGINHIVPEHIVAQSQLYGDLIGLPIYVILGTFYSFSGLLDKRWIRIGISSCLAFGILGPLLIDVFAPAQDSAADLAYVSQLITYSILTSISYAIFALIMHYRTFRHE